MTETERKDTNIEPPEAEMWLLADTGKFHLTKPSEPNEDLLGQLQVQQVRQLQNKRF